MPIPAFQKEVWAWYRKNRRVLPWRATRDPYKILVSEVMLQQTQLSRILPKYEEFLLEFPNIKALAKAPDAKLFAVWRGLGYWKRARHLKEAALRISQEHNGKIPRQPSDLEKLPGIGHYTARALACFAFNRPEAFLDTNIRRVYLHFFFPRKKNVPDKEVLKLAEQAMPKDKAREWHYALFDYGAAALRDKSINRRSRSYTKQSRFEGSFRSYRTRIMRLLLDRQNEGVSFAKISRLLKEAKCPYPVEEILQSLLTDGLLKKKGRSYSL